MKDLVNCVAGWARDRNLIEGSDAKSQYLKFCEEGYELWEGYLQGNRAKFIDGVGDQIVVLIIMCIQEGHDPHDIVREWTVEKHISFNSRVKDTTSSIMVSLRMWEGRIGANLARGRDIATPAIGYMQELIKLCNYVGVNVHECLMYAWNEICERKGKMLDGVFIKQEDLDSGKVSTEINWDEAYVKAVRPNNSEYSDILFRKVKFPYMVDPDHVASLVSSLHKDRFPSDDFIILVEDDRDQRFSTVIIHDRSFKESQE